MFKYLNMPRLVAFYLREFSGRADGEVSWLYKFIFCLCLPFVSNTFYRARLIALAIAECTESVAQIDRVLDMITASDSSSGATISIVRTNEDYFTVFGETLTPEAPPSFRIEPQVVTFTSAFGERDIQVIGPTSGWSVSSSTSWLTAAQFSLTTARLSATANTASSSRSAVATFSWTDPASGITYTQTCSVTQAAASDEAGIARISGRVLNRATLQPMADVRVEWYTPGQAVLLWAYTRSDGTYLLEASLQRSVYESWNDMSIRVFRSVSDNDRVDFTSSSVAWGTITSGIFTPRDLYLGRDGEIFPVKVGVRVTSGYDVVAGANVSFQLGPDASFSGVTNADGLLIATVRISGAYWETYKAQSVTTASATGYETRTLIGSGQSYSFDTLLVYDLQINVPLTTA